MIFPLYILDATANIDKNSFEYSYSMPLGVMTNGANAYDYVGS